MFYFFPLELAGGQRCGSSDSKSKISSILNFFRWFQHRCNLSDRVFFESFFQFFPYICKSIWNYSQRLNLEIGWQNILIIRNIWYPGEFVSPQLPQC